MNRTYTPKEFFEAGMKQLTDERNRLFRSAFGTYPEVIAHLWDSIEGTRATWWASAGDHL